MVWIELLQPAGDRHRRNAQLCRDSGLRQSTTAQLYSLRRKFVVLCPHAPTVVRESVTGCGQMVPFNLVVRAVQPVVSGYAVVDGTQVFVTNGAGFWGPPVRVGAPAEVTLVELRRAGHA